MARSKKYQKLQMAMFSRSAKMMSYELKTRREVWETEFLLEDRKAKRNHKKRYRRTATYCMHSCYDAVLVELESMLTYENA